MPPAPQYNWEHFYDVYHELLKEKPNVQPTQFARDNGLPEAACRDAFRRIKQKRERALHAKSADANARKKRKKAAPSMFDEATPEEAAQVMQCVPVSRVTILHAKVLNYVMDLFERIDKIKAAEEIIVPESIKDIKEAYQSIEILVRILQQVTPFLSELQERSGIERIVSRLQNHEIDITDASLEMSKLGVNLPEALRIMLSKTPPLVIQSSFEMPSEEELDQRALETMEYVKWQYECFLPDRREEVIELKKELGAGSFAPETKPESEKEK